MNGVALLRCNRPKVIHGLADNVDHAAKGPVANGNGNRSAEIDGLHPPHADLCGFHGDAAYAALTQTLLHLKYDIDRYRNIEAVADHANSLINGRHRRFGELHVHSRTCDLDYVSGVFHKRSSYAVSP